MTKQTEAMKLALEALRQIDEAMPFPVAKLAQSALREALANEALDRMAENARELGLDYDVKSDHRLMEMPAQQEPVAWMPIEQMYPQGKAIDILMGDGSILCALLPQFDGDLWWEGSGTGEKFIDPKYANVTHWRIHGETHPQAREPLKWEDIRRIVREANHHAWNKYGRMATDEEIARAIEAAYGIGEKK